MAILHPPAKDAKVTRVVSRRCASPSSTFDEDNWRQRLRCRMCEDGQAGSRARILSREGQALGVRSGRDIIREKTALAFNLPLLIFDQIRVPHLTNNNCSRWFWQTYAHSTIRRVGFFTYNAGDRSGHRAAAARRHQHQHASEELCKNKRAHPRSPGLPFLSFADPLAKGLSGCSAVDSRKYIGLVQSGWIAGTVIRLILDPGCARHVQDVGATSAKIWHNTEETRKQSLEAGPGRPQDLRSDTGTAVTGDRYFGRPLTLIAFVASSALQAHEATPSCRIPRGQALLPAPMSAA